MTTNIKIIFCALLTFGFLARPTIGEHCRDDGHRLLICAAENRFAEAKHLVESNVDINCISNDNIKFTPLHYALLNRNCELAEYLINNGAQTDIVGTTLSKSAAHLIKDNFCKHLAKFLEPTAKEVGHANDDEHGAEQGQ